MGKIEPLLELVDLGRKRGGVAGIAFEHLDGDRAAVGRAQQAINDLQLAALAVAIVAEPGELAATPLQIAGGDVVEHQRAILQMEPRQRGLDLGLTLQQPIKRHIELILIDLSQAENRTEAGGGELRFGTSSIYMAHSIAILRQKQGKSAHLHVYILNPRTRTSRVKSRPSCFGKREVQARICRSV